MDPRGNEIDDGTPEDVAALYAWANLTGARYRDFSALRRERNAQLRLSAAKQSLLEELEAQGSADAEGAKSAGERVEQARRSEAAAHATLRAIEEGREVAEAQESARRKQVAFEEAEQRRRERIGPQPGMTGKSARMVSEQWAQTPGVADVAQQNRVMLPVEGERAGGVADAEAPAREPSTDAAIRPAWLGPAGEPSRLEEIEPPAIASKSHAPRTSPIAATLLDSRAEVALRWPVLQTLMAQLRMQTPAAAPRISWPRGPVAAIVSPVGGAGKTSLAAALARALALAGERVLLVETSAERLLQLYFGMDAQAPGKVQTAAAGGPQHETIRKQEEISVVALDVAAAHADKRAQERAVERLLSSAQGHDRVLIDLAPDGVWIVQRLSVLRPMVLAVMTPEMNSVAGLRSMEQTFTAITDRDGRSLLPFYVLNRFDAGLPLHLDIREVLRHEFGERLLAAAVRRSSAVSEALAEAMTALDYAPVAPVARDYADLAAWLRSVSPASAEAIADAARGER